MSEVLNPKAIAQEIKIETFNAAAGNFNSLREVGLPPLHPVQAMGVNAKGQQVFKTLQTQFHIFPSFANVDNVNDAVAEIRGNLDPQVRDSAELVIMYGGSPLETGNFLKIPNRGNANGGNPTMIHLGVYVYEKEVYGAEVTLSALRKKLEGTGAL